MTRKWLNEKGIIYDKLILTDAYNNNKHAKTEKCFENNIDIMIELEHFSCPIIKEDTSYELTENRHNITFVNYLNANKIYSDLFLKLVKE